MPDLRIPAGGCHAAAAELRGALRRKLGAHAGLVETVRGVGYRWSGG